MVGIKPLNVGVSKAVILKYGGKAFITAAAYVLVNLTVFKIFLIYPVSALEKGCSHGYAAVKLSFRVANGNFLPRNTVYVQP